MSFLTGVALADTSDLCPDESGYYYTNYKTRNPQTGGFVADGAYVSEGVFIARGAAVCGAASVEDRAKIMGKAVVTGDAVVRDRARVSGSAIVGGSTILEGRVIVRGYSRLNSGHHDSGVIDTKVKPRDVLQSDKRKEASRVISGLKDYLESDKMNFKAIYYGGDGERYYLKNNIEVKGSGNCSLSILIKSSGTGHEDRNESLNMEFSKWNVAAVTSEGEPREGISIRFGMMSEEVVSFRRSSIILDAYEYDAVMVAKELNSYFQKINHMCK